MYKNIEKCSGRINTKQIMTILQNAKWAQGWYSKGMFALFAMFKNLKGKYVHALFLQLKYMIQRYA